MFIITCLVNDEIQPGSGLRAEHGLSFLIQTDEKRLLFDTGPDGRVLLYNATKLGLDLRAVADVVLSHSHPDHTGGLMTVLSLARGCRLFAHPAIFQARFARRRWWKPKYIGLPLSPREAEEYAQLKLSSQPIEVASQVWTTGEVAPRPEVEGRSARHLIRTPHGWAPDPYADDMALVLETPQGSVVVLGCAHAGFLNTLAHVRRTFDGRIQAVLGGAHLLDLGEEEIDHIIAILREEYGSLRLYLNHCTGKRALGALGHACGERVRACPAGVKVAF